MKLKITHRIEDNVCILSLQNAINWRNTEELYFYTDTLLKKESPTAFIVNLEKIPRVDSSALGILLTIYKRMRRAQVPFVLCGLNSDIRETLQSLYLKQTFSIYDTEKDAKLFIHQSSCYYRVS